MDIKKAKQKINEKRLKDLREREMWTFLAGVNDEDMRAFKLNKDKASKKLKETKYKVI